MTSEQESDVARAERPISTSGFSSREFESELISEGQGVEIDARRNLLDVAIVLAKHKRLIFGLPTAAGIIALGISFLIPNVYTATAKILPPQQNQSNPALILGQLGTFAGGAASTLGLKNPNDVFVAMLRSRSVEDRLIEKFDLKTVYDSNLLVDARKRLDASTRISSGRDGVIRIDVDDEDPKRAAALANGYIAELEGLTLRLAVSEGGQRRLFFEKQLEKAKGDLTAAEEGLKAFQEETGLINPGGQANLTVTAAAGLRGQITAKEVQLSTLRAFATEENPELFRTQQELASLRAQLAKMQRSASTDAGDVLVSIGKAPGANLEFIKKYRDVKYFETLFELLAKQYELARIDEAKNATLIQVLDPAVVPERKSGPRRGLLAVLTGVLAFPVAVLAAFILDAAHQGAGDPIRRSKFAELRTLLGKWS